MKMNETEFKKVGRPAKYPLDQLNVGEKFFLKCKKANLDRKLHQMRTLCSGWNTRSEKHFRATADDTSVIIERIR